MIKIAYLGSGHFAQKVFSQLLKAGSVQLDLVVSQPDKPVGRRQVMTPTPLKAYAIENHFNVETPINADELYELLDQDFDFVVVCDYGMILPSKLLNLAKLETLNVHPSLLPKYRGASPIQHTLLNGDQDTGVCVIRVGQELDAGEIFGCVKVPTEGDYHELRDVLGDLGGQLLIQVMQDVYDGNSNPIVQPGEPTYCGKISKHDGLVDFESDSVVDIVNKFRAFSEWPKIYFEHNGTKFKILDLDVCSETLSPGEFKEEDVLMIGTANGCLSISRIQPESKNPMKVSDFLRGNPGFFSK